MCPSLKILPAAIQQAQRALGAAKGYDFDHFHDEQLTVHFHYTVFPNISFSLKPDGCIGSEQQKGLRSRGYKGGHLAGQEGRVRFFHDTLDRWLAG
ncbi:MAG: SRPBCC family protein [Erythrobacter sp.]